MGQGARDVTVGCCSGLAAGCVASLRYVHCLHCWLYNLLSTAAASRYVIWTVLTLLRGSALRHLCSTLPASLCFACFALHGLLRLVQLGILICISDGWRSVLRLCCLRRLLDYTSWLTLRCSYANRLLLQRCSIYRISWTVVWTWGVVFSNCSVSNWFNIGVWQSSQYLTVTSITFLLWTLLVLIF